MTPAEFASSMRRVVTLLFDADVAHDVRSSHSLTPSSAFKRAALTNPRYPALYMLGLGERDYNYLLTDFSFLQFSRVEQKGFVSLRYAYYPNPFRAVTFQQFLEDNGREADTDGFEDYIQFLNGQPYENLIPVVRYDVAECDYRELEHPSAHFHFGLHADSRWAVSLRLTPFAFALQITKMFYGAEWNRSPVKGNIRTFDQLLCAEKGVSARLPASHFSHREEAQFHFG